jgi:septum formation protein
MRPLILASASASRARLLRAADVPFEAIAASVDEDAERADARRSGATTRGTACRLALRKAVKVSSTHPARHVLGADQILELDGEIIGKCSTTADAVVLLRRLRGRAHELLTAAVLVVGQTELWRHVEHCRLVMREFSDAFLADYLSRAETAALESVGCYQLEGFGVQLFEQVDGDYFSVLGLPLLPVLAALRTHGLVSE